MHAVYVIFLFLIFSPCSRTCVQQHDPLSFFAGQEELCPLSISSQQPLNVHNRVLRLRPDLFVVGFGGSIPVFKDGKQFWWSELFCGCTHAILRGLVKG